MATLQNHIHLSDALGTSPEFSPTYTWKARARIPVVNFNVEVVESLDGTRYDYVVETTGTPVRHRDWYYEFILKSENAMTVEQYVDRLVAIAGKQLYLVDHLHVATGSDHTSYIRTVRMTKPLEFNGSDPLIQHYYVGVYLSDLAAL